MVKNVFEGIQDILTPEQVGLLVSMHLKAKETNTEVFYCVRCNDMFSFKEMAKVNCYCCGNGICNKCK